jgi:predicted nucleic acid-binding protein
MAFVVDVSASLPWCFQDEATSWTEALLDRLSAGEQAHVPALWPVELGNGLLMGTRRNRIPASRAESFLATAYALPILIQPPLTRLESEAILQLCQKHRLTFYDATYLELSIRLALPLATLDDALLKAAPLEGVLLVL